jgi:hypothetical protein
LVGSVLARSLAATGSVNVIGRTCAEPDLTAVGGNARFLRKGLIRVRIPRGGEGGTGEGEVWGTGRR